jgi:amidohydrolase
MKKIVLISLLAAPFLADAQSNLKPVIAQKADAMKDKVIAWRRDFHEHPELGNQEVRTAGIVAAHLRSLGIEVQEKVAYTGVVGILRGGKPGPVIALRADMDGLPVSERVDIPFKSKVVTDFNGQKTGVMHACGHDSHVAILMGVAEILASEKDAEIFFNAIKNTGLKFISFCRIQRNSIIIHCVIANFSSGYWSHNGVSIIRSYFF